MTRRYRVVMHGRKVGAIGIMYQIPAVYVTAANPREASYRALTNTYSDGVYEHLQVESIGLAEGPQ